MNYERNYDRFAAAAVVGWIQHERDAGAAAAALVGQARFLIGLVKGFLMVNHTSNDANENFVS